MNGRGILDRKTIGNRKTIRLVTWLAVVGLLGQFVAPVSIQPAQAAGNGLIPLCTAHGIVFVPAPGDGGPPATPVQSSPFCPCCLSLQLGGEALAPIDPGIPVPAWAYAAHQIQTRGLAWAHREHGAIGARAPPPPIKYTG